MRTTAIRQRRTMKIAGITFSLALAAAALPACGVQSEPSSPGTPNTGTVDRLPSTPGKNNGTSGSGKSDTTGDSNTDNNESTGKTPPSGNSEPPGTQSGSEQNPPVSDTTDTDENSNNPSDDSYDPKIENSALIGGNINDDVKLSKDHTQPKLTAPKPVEPGTFKEPGGVKPTCMFPKKKTTGEKPSLTFCPGESRGLSGKEADDAHRGQSIAQREHKAADNLIKQAKNARAHYKVGSPFVHSADLDAIAQTVADAWSKNEDPAVQPGVKVVSVSGGIGEENAEFARPESIPAYSSIAFLLQGAERDTLLWDTPLKVGAAVKANTTNGGFWHIIVLKQDRASLPRDRNCEFPELNRSDWTGYSPFNCPGIRDITSGERTKEENKKLLADMRREVLKQFREAAEHYNWPGSITEDSTLSASVQDLAAHPNRTSPTYVFPHAGLELHAPGDDVLNTGSYPAETLIATLLSSYHESLPKVMGNDVNKFVGIGLAPVDDGKKLSFYISIRLDDGQGSGPCDFKEFPEPKKNAKYDKEGATAGRVNYCGAFSLPTAAESQRDINVRFDEARERLLKQLNKIRRQAGVPEVTVVSQNLTADAQDWALQRLVKGVKRHQTAEEFIYGDQEGEVMDDSYLPVGAGPETIKPEIIIADYLYSPHHREAILNPSLKQIGIGFAIDARSGKLINVINFLNSDRTPAINPNWKNYTE
ncbi:CAP domain-containing protein [Corynebacterium mendelii]|uniref:SCP domain-containing protein n=1 Tax=Corynebacterium mendelii TaxID=2765362 RepID=A0A939E1F1_9CORY|nr:CAP domain-containing protein [Corynebacterium mendelii]MBN9643936.1 hypothetical protein [Corynebacterium mendelii]